MDKTYPPNHIKLIGGLNALSFVVGLGMLVDPLAKHWYPGDQDTTIHVGLGALVAVCAFFRLALGYGSIWLDVVLAAFGIITLAMPTIMHKHYNSMYNTAHLAGGAILVVVALVSMIATAGVLKKMKA